MGTERGRGEMERRYPTPLLKKGKPIFFLKKRRKKRSTRRREKKSDAPAAAGVLVAVRSSNESSRKLLDAGVHGSLDRSGRGSSNILSSSSGDKPSADPRVHGVGVGVAAKPSGSTHKCSSPAGIGRESFCDKEGDITGAPMATLEAAAAGTIVIVPEGGVGTAAAAAIFFVRALPQEIVAALGTPDLTQSAHVATE